MIQEFRFVGRDTVLPMDVFAPRGIAAYKRLATSFPKPIPLDAPYNGHPVARQAALCSPDLENQ